MMTIVAIVWIEKGESAHIDVDKCLILKACGLLYRVVLCSGLRVYVNYLRCLTNVFVGSACILVVPINALQTLWRVSTELLE